MNVLWVMSDGCHLEKKQSWQPLKKKRSHWTPVRNKNLNFKNLAFFTSSPNKNLELRISAEIGEKIRRETEPNRSSLTTVRTVQKGLRKTNDNNEKEPRPFLLPPKTWTAGKTGKTPQHKERQGKKDGRKTNKSYINRGRKQGKPNKTQQRNSSKQRR